MLHEPAKHVTDFGPGLVQLVRDLEETMAAAPGVGLAAPQVGVPLRLFVYSWRDDDEVVHSGTAINPRLWISPPVPEAVEELDPEEESEGCLSIPGERFPLRRAASAILEAADLDGSVRELRADGWLARIFQHEYDHLDGVLYADRLTAPSDRGMAKAIRKNDWGLPGRSWTPGVDDLDA